MDALLTGLGLSGSAGLNAYLPLFIMGVMQRLGLMDLAEPYDNVGHPVVIGVLLVLLLIEMTADKVPAVDSLNDFVNTGIRPLAGSVLFTASTSSVESADPTMLTIMSILTGGLSAGSVHAVKAFIRPSVTVSTGGFGNIFVSLFEDGISAFVSVFAILIPFIVLFFTVSFVVLGVWFIWDYRRVKKHFPQQAYRRNRRRLMFPPQEG